MLLVSLKMSYTLFVSTNCIILGKQFDHMNIEIDCSKTGNSNLI